MKYIIYTSTASIYFHPHMLESMLTSFRKHNLKHNITGLLVYSGGTFMQYIEGPDGPVNLLIKNIIKDKIHHSVIICENRLLQARLFPDWSMSFKSASNTEFKRMMGLAYSCSENPFGIPTPLAVHLSQLMIPQAFG